MSPDILIVRDGDSYRMLHGHLHLASVLAMFDEVFVDVRDEGKVKIEKSHGEFLAGKDGHRLPLVCN